MLLVGERCTEKRSEQRTRPKRVTPVRPRTRDCPLPERASASRWERTAYTLVATRAAKNVVVSLATARTFNRADCLRPDVTQHPPYQLSVLAASLVGAAGFVLGLQAWLKFRGSPFGRVLAVLPVLMAVLALYHPILLVFPEHIEVALLIETAGFALLVLFVGLTLQMHRRMSHGGG